MLDRYFSRFFVVGYDWESRNLGKMQRQTSLDESSKVEQWIGVGVFSQPFVT